MDRILGKAEPTPMKFYTIGECPNCSANTWKRDHIDWRLKRYECFYCGQDVFLNRPRPDQIRDIYDAIIEDIKGAEITE